jgi:hypothetical protein
MNPEREEITMNVKVMYRPAALLGIIVGAGVGLCRGTGVGSGDVPFLRPGEAELFLDEGMVARTDNIRTSLQQTEKHPGNPVLVGDRPWEGQGPQAKGITQPRVFFDAVMGKFRMYYGTREKGFRFCYAESIDGVRWVKPDLGLHAFEGTRETNIVMPGVAETFWVIANPDPQASADRRYLAFTGRDRTRAPSQDLSLGGKFRSLGFASPEGIRWAPIMETYWAQDTFSSAVWCPDDRMFRAYTRNWRKHEDYGQLRYDPNAAQFRTVELTESADFMTWTTPRFLFETDAQDGAPRVQCYALGVTRYGNGFLGALSLLYCDESIAGWQRGHQRIQLMFSRDGFAWNRVGNRAVFIDHGPEGAFDWGEAYYSGGVFAHGDTTYCYYSGKSTLHKGPGEYAVGLATLPRDRLMVLEQQNASRPAVIETRTFRWHGRDLIVNTTGGGTVQVEVLDASGQPVANFAAAASHLAPADAIYQRVTWGTGEATRSLADLGGARDAGIRLRFRLDGTRLHAFQVLR